MSSSPLFHLPNEILDAILSLLDSASDIIAFALASRACSQIAIPRHTEYRILRIRHARPELWAHLAQTDLASTFTHVHISDRSACLQPDRIPHTLVDPRLYSAPARIEEQEELRIQNICKAIGTMRSLKSFVWETKSPQRPTSRPEHEDDILEALRSSSTLERLALIGPFLSHKHDPSIPFDSRSEQYPLWGFSNLKYLALYGDSWIKPTVSSHVLKLLRKIDILEHLELPLEFVQLHCLFFPNLKTLKLPLVAGATPYLDATRSYFIQAHRNLENLWWFPVAIPTLAPDSLPNLRSLTTTRHVIECLASIAPLPPTPSSMTFAVFQTQSVPLEPITEDPRESNSSTSDTLPENDNDTLGDGTIRRPIENLDIRSLDARSLVYMHRYFMDPRTLKKLRIHIFHDVDDMCRIGDTFMNVTWLRFPSTHLPTDAIHPIPVKLNDLFSILSHFPRLEVLRGQVLWEAVKHDKDRMHLAIHNLVQMLPNLRELDYSSFDEKRQGFRRIIITTVIKRVLMPRKVLEGNQMFYDDGDVVRNEGGEMMDLDDEDEFVEVERKDVNYYMAKAKARDVWDICEGAFD